MLESNSNTPTLTDFMRLPPCSRKPIPRARQLACLMKLVKPDWLLSTCEPPRTNIIKCITSKAMLRHQTTLVILAYLRNLLNFPTALPGCRTSLHYLHLLFTVFYFLLYSLGMLIVLAEISDSCHIGNANLFENGVIVDAIDHARTLKG